MSHFLFKHLVLFRQNFFNYIKYIIFAEMNNTPMTDIERENIVLKITAVKSMVEALDTTLKLKLDSNHDEFRLILNQILEQTTKTNGRVTKLEGKVDKIENQHAIEIGKEIQRRNDEKAIKEKEALQVTKTNKGFTDIILSNKKYIILCLISILGLLLIGSLIEYQNVLKFIKFTFNLL